MTGTILAGFEILDQIGEGGMGAVYRARQISLDRIVAIKLLPPGLADSPDEVERFKREARAAAILNHNGIVQVHEAGEEDGVFYFVMEFVDGRSIGDWLRDEKVLAPDDVLRIALSVSEALGYAWDKASIVHRDIKPDNILIDDDATIKVADLGLMKMSGHEDASQESMCTPNYVSPEQACDDEVDCRADIYSLGATLYHLCTGVMPFGNLDPEDAIDQQIDGHLQNPRELNGQISIGLANVLRKMMAKQTHYRYHDWSEVTTDIKRLQNRRKPLKMLHPAADSTIRTLDSSVVPVNSGTPATVPHGRSATKQIQVGRSRRHGRKRKKSRGAPIGVIMLLLLLVGALGLAAVVMINKANDERRRRILIHSQKTTPPSRAPSNPVHNTADHSSLSTHDQRTIRDTEIEAIMQKLKTQAQALQKKDIQAAMAIYRTYNGPYNADTLKLRRNEILALKALEDKRTAPTPRNPARARPVAQQKPPSRRVAPAPERSPKKPKVVAPQVIMEKPAVATPPPPAESAEEVKALRNLNLMLKQIGIRLTLDMTPSDIAAAIREKEYDARRARIARDKLQDFRRTYGDSDTAGSMSDVLNAVEEYSQ